MSYVKDIKSFVNPSSWRYRIDYINSVDWERKKKEIRHAPQPIIATMFNHALMLYPAPTAVETLDLLVILKAPATSIDVNTDPELGSEWDEALKYFALFDLTGDADYYKLFEEQIRLIGASTYSSGGTIQKKMV